MTRTICSALVLFALVACAAFAAGRPEDSGQGVYVDDRGTAIQGADVVAYFYLPAEANAVYGKEEFFVRWKGAKWLFITEENRDRFAESPDVFAPRYGGYCAYAMAQDRLARSTPDAWTIRGDGLYLNSSAKVREQWRRDPEACIERADRNWPDHLREIRSRDR